jgi:hypothetical protein
VVIRARFIGERHYVVIRARFISERHRKLKCSFHQMRTGTCYAEHVSLHQLGSVGHVVNSYVSDPQNITHYFLCSGWTGAVSIKSASGHVTLNLCFCIKWDLLVMCCIPVQPTAKHRRTIFHARVGLVQFP